MKRLFRAGLVFALLLNPGVAGAGEWGSPASAVSRDHWAYAAMASLERVGGLPRGVGLSFQERRVRSREDFAAAIREAMRRFRGHAQRHSRDREIPFVPYQWEYARVMPRLLDEFRPELRLIGQDPERELFVLALDREDLAAAKELRGRVSSPPPPGRSGVTVLMLACGFADEALVEEQLRCGADPNARDRAGASAIYYAGAFGNAHVVDRLAQAGVAIDAPAPGGYSALYWAAVGGRLEGVRSLLRQGAEPGRVNSRITGRPETALYAATYADAFLHTWQSAKILRLLQEAAGARGTR
jgi:hypothetical protein